MRAVRNKVLLGALGALMSQLCVAEEAVPRVARNVVIAQTTMGAPEISSPSPTPAPPSAPLPPPSTRPAPQMGTIPPPGIVAPRQTDPPSLSQTHWGAIGFTASGTYWTTWKQPSQGAAEAEAAKGCSKFGHGGCEVISFSGQKCGALATFKGRRLRLSVTAGAETYPDSQRAVMQRCNSDQRTGGRCQFRTAVCADGR